MNISFTRKTILYFLTRIFVCASSSLASRSVIMSNPANSIVGFGYLGSAM